jgi:predicted lactoylglutathione lyase
MEITSFYPMIISEDIEATKATYEALGFKVAHVITDPLFDYKDQNQFVIMKNENGLRVCIYTSSEVNAKEEQGNTWVNVRDFDAACAILKEHGFTVNSEVYDLKYMKIVAMIAPEGNVLTIVYHKREHDED